MIPLAVTIPVGERDETLTESLKVEWPGILAWAIQDCLIWQAHGLQPLKAVREATDAYLQAEDAMAAWIDEKGELTICIVNNALTVSPVLTIEGTTELPLIRGDQRPLEFSKSGMRQSQRAGRYPRRSTVDR
jgi:phage/plasmid-associated DNA primase